MRIDISGNEDTAQPSTMHGILQILASRLDRLTVETGVKDVGLYFLVAYQPPDVVPYAARNVAFTWHSVAKRLRVPELVASTDS